MIFTKERSYMTFTFTEESFKDTKGFFDVRKCAYALARHMLANGCLLRTEYLRTIDTDSLQCKVIVSWFKEEKEGLFKVLK